jgi:hypothetical protein
LATKVYDEVEIELSNGDVVTLKPLPIKQLRKFMEIIKKLNEENIEDETEAMEVFVEACMVCMEKIKPELSTDRDLFEESIEVPTMMKILEIAGGLKLNDPNLLGAGLVGMD